MPLYTYTCQSHGVFEAWAKMADSDRPVPCPTCAAPSPRALAKPMLVKGASAEDGAEASEGCGLEGCGMGACGEEGCFADEGHVCGEGCAH
ncbi:MAG: zinc ribbon domain-containing protein [Geminicoccaceae bacterium]|nr:zinc ribbon domain-containing protein [Geminicoccaceae bacterium]MCS7268883.1 zinc ribbon domain-containing protein [Geminicoccaceae bacterium]MCX7629582.1 zinc ribbon domain-containing protein [Geminicoccaceae bacterium]MDW8125169.1 zinc ribbon domain-containing protein [Geminicoccaceae bacterium]MDW8341989.1 zinc ribbon domain-containing protein [Geminicoccaceae bacterium]